MDENAILRLCGGFIVGVGLILLLIGTIPLMRTFLFLRKAVETTGTIVDLRVETGESKLYQATFEFKTHEGETVRWTQFGWRSRFPGDVGTEVPMKYNPQNPMRARPVDVRDMWLFGAMLSSMGLAFGGLGLWLVLNGE